MNAHFKLTVSMYFFGLNANIVVSYAGLKVKKMTIKTINFKELFLLFKYIAAAK